MTSHDPSSSGGRSILDFIQALRGGAALLVVLYHGSRFISPYGTGLGDVLFGTGGHIGVDLFFIISGFIMTHTTRSNDGSLGYFLMFAIKRFTRIWPTYVVIVLLYIFIRREGGRFFLETENLKLFLYTIGFVNSGRGGPPDFGLPVLNVGWTLNYEMYFYLVFGLALLFGAARWWAFGAWMALSLLLLPLLHGNAPSLHPGQAYGFRIGYLNLITSPLIWLFVLGTVIGNLYHSPLRIASSFLRNHLLFLAFTLVVWQYLSRFQADHGLLSWGWSLGFLVLVLSLASKDMVFSIPKPILHLGNISYSLYLIHPLVQEGLEEPLATLGLGAYTQGFSFLFLTTALSILLASLSQRWLERDLSNWLRDTLLRSLLRTRFKGVILPVKSEA
ncbi:acyltransferase family protein [Candidatus Methylocalor cossyra]|uniref:Acyltransferase 3 n=1 Tax=Candidatus Methylocalor cossyra TaxID=3108543 RepID=A0ABM9NFQ7_9GAMM